MIILSQDKRTIINFKNVEVIGVGNPLENDEGNFLILIDTTSDNEMTIGEYKTEERAKEVLQEIIRSIIEFKKSGELGSIFGFQTIPENTYYEMPKE